MKIELEIIGRKTIVTYNGKTKEHKSAFLNRLIFKDAIYYITEQ